MTDNKIIYMNSNKYNNLRPKALKPKPINIRPKYKPVTPKIRINKVTAHPVSYHVRIHRRGGI